MADLTLALTGVSASGVAGTLGGPIFATAGLALPVPTLVISGGIGNFGSVSLTLPTPVFTASAPSAAALTLPTPTLATSGQTGLVGSVVLTLPTPRLQISPPSAITVALPTPTLAAQALVGAVGSVTLNFPSLLLDVETSTQITAAPALILPTPVLAITGSAGLVGSVNASLTRLTLAASGHTGVIGSATLTVPIIALSASGYQNTVGFAQLTLPSLQLKATGFVPRVAPVSGVADALVMHTEQMGLTTYSNYPFNSFAKFNGVYLGATDGGLFLLSGDTDNGTLIQAAARVGVTDMNTSHLKRVDRVYVGYRTTGDLVLRVITDETDQRDYRMLATGKTGLHGNHVRIGKGLAARYWQFEIRNLNGCYFDLNMIELKPTVLVRRVGGRDA